MRKLNKGEPLTVFTECIRDNKPANWEAFSKDHQTISQEVRLYILCEEQDSLCGYTELPVDDPFDCHIDHFRKKSQFPTLTFDWNNFIVATMDDDFGARYKDAKSGITAADYALILNPTIDQAESYFEYSELGEILPKPKGLTLAQKALAQKTIDVFNLKAKALRERRYGLIKMIEAYGDLPADEIKACLENAGFKSLIEQYTQGK